MTQIFKDQAEVQWEQQPGEQFEYHLINAIPANGQSTMKIQKGEDLILSKDLGEVSEKS